MPPGNGTGKLTLAARRLCFNDAARRRKFSERSLIVAGMHVHGPRRICDDVRLKSSRQSIQRRCPHAVIKRQPTDPHSGDSSALQFTRQLRPLKRRIGFLVGARALADDRRAGRHLQIRMKLRAVRLLRAMTGPRAAALAKAAMIARVPIARCDNERTTLGRRFDPVVEHRNDFVTARYRQSTARAKVILHIDND